MPRAIFGREWFDGHRCNVFEWKPVSCSAVPCHSLGGQVSLILRKFRQPCHVPFASNPDFLLGGRTSASAEYRHWSGRAVRWSRCAILLSATPASTSCHCAPKCGSSTQNCGCSGRLEGSRERAQGGCCRLARTATPCQPRGPERKLTSLERPLQPVRRYQQPAILGDAMHGKYGWPRLHWLNPLRFHGGAGVERLS